MSTRQIARRLLTPLLSAAALLAVNVAAYGQFTSPTFPYPFTGFPATGQQGYTFSYNQITSVWSGGPNAPLNQPFTWNGGGGSGDWTVGANWVGGVAPTSGADRELVMNGAVQTSTFFPTNFQISYLTFTAGSNFTVGTAGTTLDFVTGNFKTRTGNNDDLAGTGYDTSGVNDVYGAAGLIRAAITTQGSKTAFVNSDIKITTAQLQLILSGNDINGAELVISGGLSGTGALKVAAGVTAFAGQTIVSAGTSTNAVLRSSNNTAYTGNVTIDTGVSLMLGAPNALFRKNNVSLTTTTNSLLFIGTTTAAGSASAALPFADAGYNQQLGGVNGAGQLLLGTGGGAAQASTLLLGYSNAGSSFTGSGSLSGVNPLSQLGKVGAGTLSISTSDKNPAFAAGVSIRDGIVSISGALGSLYQNTGAVSAWNVYRGATLQLNNATAATDVNGRLTDTLPVTLAGGSLQMNGNAATFASNNEVVGYLTPYAGQSVIFVNAAGGATPTANAAVTFGGAAGTASTLRGFDETQLSRGGQVGFAGQNLGTGTGVTNTNVLFASSVTNANISNLGGIGGILPWSLVQTNYTGTNTFTPNSFATYNAVTGITGVTFDASNVNATTSADLGATVNSVVLGTGGNPVLAGVTTLTSGALLSTAAANTITGAGSITTNGARAYISANTALTVSVPVTAAGLSKGGAGTLTLGTVNFTAASQVLAVNAGTLVLTAPVTGATVVYQPAKLTTLTVPAAGLTVDGTLRGAGTVGGGTVTIGSTGLLGASALAGNLGTGAAPEILTFTSPLALNGGARLRFYISSVYGNQANDTVADMGRYTQGRLQGTTLDLSGASAANKIVIQPHSLALSNSGNGALYDFDNTKTYAWVLGTFTGGIIGFSADKFDTSTALSLSNFTDTNNLGAGSFSVTTSGNDLILSFGAVIPEPTLIGFAAFGLALVARRRMKA